LDEATARRIPSASRTRRGLSGRFHALRFSPLGVLAGVLSLVGVVLGLIVAIHEATKSHHSGSVAALGVAAAVGCLAVLSVVVDRARRVQ
jgi:hypothetical protein